MKNNTLLHIGLIIVLGLVVYANSLSGGFVWDDNAFIKDNAHIKDWHYLGDMFAANSKLGASLEIKYYRPLQTLTYMLDYSLWRLNVFGYHLTNTLLHIGVAIAIYWFILLLYNNRLLSLLTAILFVVYPVHTDAVSYISGRGDILSSLFMLLSFICYLKQARGIRINSCILMLLSYLLALLAKENALIMPILLLLYHFSFRKKLNFKLFYPFLVIVLVYMLFRTKTLSAFYPGSDILWKRIPGFFVAIINYMRILLIPVDLHMDYGNRFFYIADPKALFGFLLVFLLLAFAFKSRDKDKINCFFISWFFIALLPSSGIYPITAFYMAEHFLYLPSVGFFVILANGLVALYAAKRGRIIALGFIISLVLFYSFLTIIQNKYWQAPIYFYERTLQYTPLSADVHNNLGTEYSKNGQKAKAIEHFKKAVTINPKMAIAFYNLGNAYFDSGDTIKAIAQLEKAIENDPNYVAAYNDICNAYITTGKYQEAIKSCKKAIQLKPEMAIAYYNLGNAYDNLGQQEKAIKAERKAIEIDPYYIEAYNNLAATYSRMGRLNEAIGLWNKILQLSPDFATAHFNLAVFYYQQGKYDLAIKHCDKVVELGNKVDPQFLRLLAPYRQK